MEEVLDSIKDVADEIREQQAVKLDDKGRELLDSRPMELPLDFKASKPLAERVRELIRGELSTLASNLGNETFEEADDFDVGDDYDPTSPYELDFDPEHSEYEHVEPGSGKQLIEERPDEVKQRKDAEEVKKSPPEPPQEKG